MNFADHNHPATNALARALATLSLVFTLCAAPDAFALDTGDIVVASSKGEVHISVRGTDTKLRAGSVLELPATVRTGRDGAIELRQGATSINVGPDTILEFPALEKQGGSIDRIVQPRGTAFYNVGKRPGRKLRIETPFLVGVVKGTQFSVVAQDHATTISLFEGLLEIRSADDSDVIDLHAGEVASRDRAATDISVLKMEADATPPVQKAPASKPAGAGGTPAPQPNPVRPAGNASGPTLNVGSVKEQAPPRVPATTVGEKPVDHGSPRVDLGVGAPDAGAAVQVSVDTPAPVGGASVDLEAPANVSVDVAAETPATGGANVDVAVETPATGGANVDVAVETPATGAPAVDLGGAAVVDTIDTGANADLGTGQGNGAAATVDVSAGDGAATVDVGANANDNGVGVGLGVGVGNVDVDLGVGLGQDTDIDLGLDDDDRSGNSGSGSDNSGSGNSGSGSGNSGGGSDNSGPGNASDVVDGLLDSITRRSGKQ